MKYILIKGTYHVIGQSPDADSLKFRAATPALWKQVETDNRAAFERELTENSNVVMLRLQGIDALETHYSPPPLPVPADVRGKQSSITTLLEPKTGAYKQLVAMGLRSTHELLNMIGVTDVKWRTFGRSTYISQAHVSSGAPTGVIKTKLQDNIPGYIICNDVEQNGRPLSWMFAGETTLADGADISLDQLAEMLESSANYRLLRRGMVYPLFFMSLSGRLRIKMAAAAQAAYDEAKLLSSGTVTPADQVTNIWQIDQSLQGMPIPSLDVLVSERALFPYLFRKVIRHYYRRQMEYYWDCLRGVLSLTEVPQQVDLAEFFRDENPYVFVISDQDFLRLNDVLEVRSQHLHMKKPPHDLVLLS